LINLETGWTMHHGHRVIGDLRSVDVFPVNLELEFATDPEKALRANKTRNGCRAIARPIGYCAVNAANRAGSGWRVAARVHLEIADDAVTRRRVPAGEERGMPTHRCTELPVVAPSRGPCRMRLKENNRRP
jgi:hypothetical protein